MDDNNSDEASVFGTYYLGYDPDEHVKNLYHTYIDKNLSVVSPSELRVVQLALQKPWKIPFFDAALAIMQPHAELRRRLYVMFALLESHKSYSTLFLSQKRQPFYIIFIIWTCISAVFKAVVGLIMLKVVK